MAIGVVTDLWYEMWFRDSACKFLCGKIQYFSSYLLSNAQRPSILWPCGEPGTSRARVSASTDSWLLKIGSESASTSWAGRRFHSRMVLFTNECLISLMLPVHSQDLWWCDAPVLESARCSHSRSGVTDTSPCSILYMRERRWDFRLRSKVCHLRSLASWETLTRSRGLFPRTQCTALFCIFCSASSDPSSSAGPIQLLHILCWVLLGWSRQSVLRLGAPS